MYVYRDIIKLEWGKVSTQIEWKSGRWKERQTLGKSSILTAPGPHVLGTEEGHRAQGLS